MYFDFVALLIILFIMLTIISDLVGGLIFKFVTIRAMTNKLIFKGNDKDYISKEEFALLWSVSDAIIICHVADCLNENSMPIVLFYVATIGWLVLLLTLLVKRNFRMGTLLFGIYSIPLMIVVFLGQVLTLSVNALQLINPLTYWHGTYDWVPIAPQ